MKALSRFTMLDLTHMLSGPYATMLLTDLGMRTIKVEPPGTGEGTRRLLAGSPAHARDGVGAYYLTLNRGKESVAIDLKSDSGRDVFYRLVARADVVVDNFAAGVTERLGIGPARLAEVNPRIVTCSVTGFGTEGPGARRPAFDLVAQAMGGGMSLTGEPGGRPMRSGIPIGDLGGGLFAVIGILSALHDRDRTGLGQHVDISMLDAQVSMLNYMASMFTMSGTPPRAEGNGHFVHVPYNTFPTATRDIVIAVIADNRWPGLLRALDAPHLDREELRGQPGRLAAKAEIEAEIGTILARQPVEHWLERLEAEGVPCAPVNGIPEAISDPQILHRNMMVEIAMHEGEALRAPGNPVKLSANEDPATRPVPPRLGAQTDAVLSGLLGLGAEEIAALRRIGAVG